MKANEVETSLPVDQNLLTFNNIFEGNSLLLQKVPDLKLRLNQISECASVFDHLL